MDNVIYIYTLSHPLSGEVKYVGKTIDPKSRLRHHIKDAKSGRRNNLSCNWVKSLLKLGLQPKMDIIDEIKGDWEWLEVYWISQFKTWGFNLKNLTEGGDSNPMSNPISRKKLSNKLKGRVRSKKHCDAISNAKKGISVHTKESKEKISEKTKGNKNPFYGKKHSEENKKKMGEPVLQYDMKGNFIKEWYSVTYAVKSINDKWSIRYVSACAKGDKPSAYGFKWKYKNGKGRG